MNDKNDDFLVSRQEEKYDTNLLKVFFMFCLIIIFQDVFLSNVLKQEKILYLSFFVWFDWISFASPKFKK